MVLDRGAAMNIRYRVDLSDIERTQLTALLNGGRPSKTWGEAKPAFRNRLIRYLEAMNSQTMQTAACNGRHDLEQRLARWLLMAHDRADGDEFQITQENLALMLCV
jgi:CRP-like cAMP-binding protein